MTDDGKSGALSMEEILAEIRRTAAERPHAASGSGMDLDAPQSSHGEPGRESVSRGADRVHGTADAHAHPHDAQSAGARPIGGVDPALDVAAAADMFDLPAILKTPRPTAVVRPLRPSSGNRLTDALRSAGLFAEADPRLQSDKSQTANQIAEEHRAVVAFESAAPARAPAAAPRGGLAYIDIRLRRGARGDRESPPLDFRATDAQTTSVAAYRGDTGEAIVGHALALASALEVDLNRRRMRVSTGAGGHALRCDEDERALRHAAAQDSVAELLRPMLRQWIAENMPRIVETALHMEVADGISSGGRNSKSEIPTP